MLKDKKVRIAITKDSHWYFFHFYFAHYVTYATALFHNEIFNLTQNETLGNFFLVSFRGSGKSSIITTSYPLWAILGKQQKKFVLILARTQAQAKQYMMSLRNELESNVLLKNDLGPFREISNEWGSSTLVFSKLNARITAASSEQSIRGMRHNQHRPDLVIGDDVEDIESNKTRESRNKTYEWWTGEVIPIGQTDTRFVLVGNLLHEDSLLMRIKEGIQQGLLDGILKEYPLIKDDQILWPGKYPSMEAIEIQKRKAGNEIAWQREYLLNIVSNEDQPIKREWIQYYDLLPPDNYHSYYATGIDLAISLKDHADYTAMVSAKICGRGENLRICILPNVVNKRMTTQEILEQAKAISASFGRGKLFIEDNGFQISFVDHLKNKNYLAEGVRSVGDKYGRLASISFLVQSGKVLFPIKGAEVLIQQLLNFGIEKHDDLADAFSLLLGKIAEKDCHRGSRGIVFNGPRFDAL